MVGFIRRYRQVHDFWHVLSNLDTSVLSGAPAFRTIELILSEITVKWLEWIQTGLPMCGLSATFGPMRLSWQENYQLISSMIPWAIRCGSRSKNLMNVYYEKHFEQDINEFCNELGFEPFSRHISDKE